MRERPKSCADGHVIKLVPWSAVLAFLLVPNIAHAIEVSLIDVQHHDARYRVKFVVELQPDPESVREVVLRHRDLKDLSRTIIESEILTEPSADTPRVRIVLRPCVWIFCKTLVKVSDVEVRANGDIVHRTVPELSSFEYAIETIRVVPGKTDGTRFHYDAELTLKNRAFPVIGPALIKRRIKKELLITSRQVEQMAGAEN